MKTTRIAAVTALLLAACTSSPGEEPWDGTTSEPSAIGGGQAGTETGTGPTTNGAQPGGGTDGARPGAGEDDTTAIERPSNDPESIVDEEDDPVQTLPLTPENWMEALPGLAKKPLNEIVVPGTHDSGTYELISTYVRPVDDVFAPDADAVKRLGSFTDLAEKWGKAQSKNLATQLADGMRYVDLRPCKEKNGTIRVCHALYGPKMGDLLDDIRAFADAHPKEIVFVDLDGYAGFGEGDYATLGELVKKRIGSRLVDHSAGDVSATMKLGELRAKHPQQNVFVIGTSSLGPHVFPRNDGTLKNSYTDTWDKKARKQSIVDALASATSSTFFITSLQVTPDAKLIASSIDPLGNYPKSLKELAEDSNPVALGWVRDEWSKQRLNFLVVDFYEDTCLFKLAMKLNGAPGIDLDQCDIGKTTPWGSYSYGPYGRGAGTPMVCSSSQEMIAGLCYTKCEPGYTSSVFFPTVCAQPCPSGYRDDGLTCFRDASIISANTSSCPWYDKCGLGLKKGCSKCPSGYSNDGCTCRRDPHAMEKRRYDRGVGVIPSSCRAGEEKDGLLCYPECREGWNGVGPMCWPQ